MRAYALIEAKVGMAHSIGEKLRALRLRDARMLSAEEAGPSRHGARGFPIVAIGLAAAAVLPAVATAP